MTDRQLVLINKINDYVNGDRDDLYLDFDDYRELNDWLQKSLKLKELVKDLHDVANALCDRMTDFPAGCDACWLCEEGQDLEECDFNKVAKTYKEVMR